MAKVLIIAEHSKGQIKKATLSSVTAASKIGGGYSIVVVGKDVGGVAQNYSKFGAEKVFVIDGDSFRNYIAENYAEAIAQLIRAQDFEFVFGSATAFTKDLIPRIAAKFDAGMASEVLAIEVNGNDVVFARPMWAGNAIAHIK
ncbi:MAG: electron transfer flavoprotein subunit alpha/FixB family protein, partial [Deltaproteobacteria bacterium]|nr:electron transfer flavoprotein subunit alpha/FixB family protein [Deltaproteobacteria bacterium]